jgi:energy-coupling factor transporter ATP-binding protein EcfA2
VGEKLVTALSLDLREVRYGSVIALRDVSLTLEHGEIVGVAGHVGAGKTTLALAAAGLLGRSVPARVDGVVTHASGGEPPAAFVFANPWTQLTELGGTVEEEVAVGPENQGLSSGEIRARVDGALGAVAATALARRVPYELSGGELQRVALASALALDAPLLVLDEPTAQLDPESAGELVDRLRATVTNGRAILIVEQNLEVLLALASRVLVLADGTVRASGTPRDVLERWPPVDTRLGVPAHVEAIHLPERRPPEPRASRALEVSRLRVAYDGVPVLDELSTTVEDGEVVAWVGRNGAGKSTLARAVMGLVPAGGGTVRVGETWLDPLPVEERARHVGLVFQDPGRQLFSRTVLDEVLVAPRALGLPDEAARASAGEALETVGLSGEERGHPADLTPQAQRRLAIAAALAGRPRVLLLDEPTAGQDAEGRMHIARALELQRRRGAAAVITHDRVFARRACDRVVTIAGGRASSMERARGT